MQSSTLNRNTNMNYARSFQVGGRYISEPVDRAFMLIINLGQISEII